MAHYQFYRRTLQVPCRLSVGNTLGLYKAFETPLCIQSSGALFDQNFQQRRFAGNDLKVVSDRIKSVKSIQKITKAMKMIAAAKLRGDQSRLENGYSFSEGPKKIISRLNPDDAGKGELTIVAFTSDKGLCGAVNSSVARQVRQLIVKNEADGHKVTIIGIGDKIKTALARLFRNRFSKVINELGKLPLSFNIAALLSERIVQEKPERLLFVYNHFINVIRYDTINQSILTKDQAEKMDKHQLDFYEFEPEKSELWQDLHELYYACSIYGSMLDSLAAEQSARLTAMDNASSNAGDMISSLTLKYNRARQAKITSELIEIISGANAVG